MRLSAVEHIAVLLAALLCAPLTAGAQQEEGVFVRSNDTLNYTYVPCPEAAAEPVADSVAERPGFFRRLVNYFDSANEDHTFEKKLDISFIGGPSYSNTEKLGLGVMAAGLYRTDRTDSVTSPSNVSLYAAASTSGFYTVGIRGMHIFRHDRNRICVFGLSWGIRCYALAAQSDQAAAQALRYEREGQFCGSACGRYPFCHPFGVSYPPWCNGSCGQRFF